MSQRIISKPGISSAGARRLARPALAAVALLLGACATTPVNPRRPVSTSAPTSAGLHGVAGGRLLDLTGKASRQSPPRGDEGQAPSAIDDVSAMTYDPDARRLYAIADASSKPRLIAFDPASGEATSIGPIEAPDLDVTVAEALAVDPRTGRLYAAGGDSTFASNVLLIVDPATGEARQVAGISRTVQNEIDAMAFAGDMLYAIDGAGNSGTLYRIDPQTGQALRVNKPFVASVTDLAFDGVMNRLVAAQGTKGPLLAVSLDGKTVHELPAAAAGLTAVAIIPTTPAVFEDGFESGDASAWSQRSKKKKKKKP